MTGFVRRFLLILAMVCFAAGAAQAQDPPSANATSAQIIADLDTKGADYEAAKASVAQTLPSEDRAALRERVLAIQGSAEQAVTALTPMLDAMDKRIADLGEASETEAPDIKAQREALKKERTDLDSAIKRARLLATNARDSVETINRMLAEEFNRSTFERVSSPLTGRFWNSIALSMRFDILRATSFGRDTLEGVTEGFSGSGALVFAASLGVSLVLLYPVRRRLRAVGRRFAIAQAPGTRARRSGLALWFILVGTLTASLSFLLFGQGLRWAGVLTEEADALLTSFIGAASFGAFIVSLGGGLLLVDQPSWRLLPLSNDAAARLRPYPSLAAILVTIGITVVAFNRIVGASPSSTVAANLAIAVAYMILIGSVLLTLRRLRRAQVENTTPTALRSVVTLTTLVCWLALIVSVLAALQGYVNLSLFIGRQTVWITVVCASAYLLLVVVDDLCTTIFSPEAWTGRAAYEALGLKPSTVGQLGVALSALLRIGVVLLALAMIFAPFGPGTDAIFSQLGDPLMITVGGFTLEPGAVLRALIALALGIAAMRLVRRWLNETYLPTTELDAGARNSVSMIVSYAGIILAGFWGLTSLGIGLERIALVVSALSVGIGFGLQAITQNFVSGLILLAERPVKLGDSVRIGTDEGDVRRISVRSTEIQLPDRSTLIVPNSEFITKPIRNMTLADPVGRVQIAFSVHPSADPLAIRKAVMEIFDEHPAVLEDPKPNVFIDSIADGKVNFNCFAFVASPRQAYSTRSAILFSVLERFQADDVKLAPTVT
ncbi:hypothetical protein NS365_17040 [Aureimonas ureilytica]|uniref:Uncharacterized protein n=1 Tax=Aureimonas ureilytica TaxID=401562 RepID=A0A175RM43_9HYPH|nr:DUF3772 domain-containing protein [Aureimonas ureilytica]KTR03872.1 hypothetical protein NS365_17040 [Aureimonas ureilytica]